MGVGDLFFLGGLGMGGREGDVIFFLQMFFFDFWGVSVGQVDVGYLEFSLLKESIPSCLWIYVE